LEVAVLVRESRVQDAAVAEALAVDAVVRQQKKKGYLTRKEAARANKDE
jgi:uncharacterized protein YwbE